VDRRDDLSKSEGAKILFVVLLVLAVLSFLGHGYRGGFYWNT